jgi:hypothetical protein
MRDNFVRWSWLARKDDAAIMGKEDSGEAVFDHMFTPHPRQLARG